MKKRRIDVVAAGGLANRMRAIAAGVALAKDAGAACRVLWCVCDELRSEFEELFEAPPVRTLPFSLTTLHSAWSRFRVSPPGKRNLYFPALLQIPFYGVRVYDNINSEWYGDHPEELLKEIGSSTLIDDHRRIGKIRIPSLIAPSSLASGREVLIFSGQVFYPFGEDLYRGLFRFSAKVERRARELQGEVERFDYGMHIRQTDNHLSIANSPIEIFEEKIDEILEANPKAKIFLASDSQEVKSRLEKKYGDRIRFNRRVAERNSPEGMLDAAAEMLILSRTGRIFGSFWSSYSEAAAMLGGVPLEILTNSNK